MRLEIIDILAKVGGIKSEAKREEVVTELLTLFAQNKGGTHAPYDENGTMMVWCSRHGEYHPIDLMVPNKSKEIGVANYCRAAQRKWEWMHAKYSVIMSLAAINLAEENNPKARALGLKYSALAQKLKNTKNLQTTFENIDKNMDPKEVVALCEEEFFADFPELKSKPKSK